jgi:CheY-like chemotaxis protein
MRTLEQSGQTVQCLIIDDDRIDAEVVKRLLKKAEINNPVTHASDAHQALKTLQAWEQDEQPYPPVLVFLDLRMPRMSGSELMERLVNEPFAPRLNIMVVTTSRHPNDEKTLSSYKILGSVNKKDLTHDFDRVLTQLGQSFELKSA